MSEKKQGELAVDLIDGFLAPSWQARNLFKYSTASTVIQEQDGIVLYKKELFHFWKGDRVYSNAQEEQKAEKARELLVKAIEEEVPLCIITGSGGPTPFSDVFIKFWEYINNG